MKRVWYLGIDDTDGYSGGCTTYTMSRVIDKLMENHCELIGFPRLIRLNPNVPFKTRGNGALSIEFSSTLNYEQIAEIVRNIVENDTQNILEPEQAQPCAILLDKRPPVRIYWDAVQKFLDKADFLEKYREKSLLGEPSRALVGALSSIAVDLSDDYTYELLAYRKKENLGKERVIGNIKEMVIQFPDHTFSSYDFEQERELIAPSGPDPVFLGIRGENVEKLKVFFSELDIEEELESYTIFQTNQATGAHVLNPLADISPYTVISADCEIVEAPEILQGGHVMTLIRMGYELKTLMCFEPTKQLTHAVRQLFKGDTIFIHAAVSEDGTSLSLEEFMLVNLVDRKIAESPMCKCGTRMISAGFLKGYKCKNCSNRSWKPNYRKVNTFLQIGQRYYASASAQRHLTRPSSRELVRNRKKVSENQFRVNLNG